MDSILAWHFLPDDGRLRYEPRTLVSVGETLVVEPPIHLCERGLHASRRIIDALDYAPGALVCLVRSHGAIIESTDKLVSTHRTVLHMADATQVLHLFACDVAEEALERAGSPDPRSTQAIDVKRRWVRGEASDSELDAARAAARAAARDAAWAAARAAARDAAWAAARAAAWDAYNARLTDLLLEHLGADDRLRAEVQR